MHLLIGYEFILAKIKKPLSYNIERGSGDDDTSNIVFFQINSKYYVHLLSEIIKLLPYALQTELLKFSHYFFYIFYAIDP